MEEGLQEAAMLVQELADFRARLMATFNATCWAKAGGHDDLVLAVAPAVRGGSVVGSKTHGSTDCTEGQNPVR